MVSEDSETVFEGIKFTFMYDFQEFVGDIADAVTNGNAPEEFVIECLGTLSNILTLNNNIDIYAVVERYNLIDCILKWLDNANQCDAELVRRA